MPSALDQLNDLMRTMNLAIVTTYDLQVPEAMDDGAYETKRFFRRTSSSCFPALGET